MTEKQPDIMIYMSDQHGADFCRWGRVKVDTPVLEEMREHGTSFDAAYTPCPLCVPARMSMMSAKLPSKTGVYENGYTLSNLTPCFTHALAAAGYETVLVGRMHFIGGDQRHGFTRRLAPDITPVSWKKPFGEIVKERGRTVAAFSSKGAVKLAGAGVSIVTDYDRMVVEHALQYLNEEHKKPQFILVGTFGPHFPYITDEEMYRKYYERVGKLGYLYQEQLPEFVGQLPMLEEKVKGSEVTPDIARGCLAAYCGQIEVMDRQVGILREKFREFTERRGRDSVFGYLSDHGDMAGEKYMYGKQTYFDKSSRIPMIFEGSRISGNRTIKSPVSLMDVGPTVCDMAGTSFSIGDGISLKSCMEDGKEGADSERVVVSQLVDMVDGRPCASIMLRYQQYKYILYHGYEEQALLFDLSCDGEERHNIVKEHEELAAWFCQMASQLADFDRMEREYLEHRRDAKLFCAFEAETGLDDSERWKDNAPETTGALSITAVDCIETVNRAW